MHEHYAYGTHLHSIEAYLRRSARPALRPGDRVRLIDELGGGNATVKDRYREAGLWQVELSGGKNVVVSDHGLRKAMTWRPGDVVVVRYHGETSTPYTYVRGQHGWPGENRAAKTDEQMSELYYSGKAKPVLAAGGEAFPAERLA